MVFLGEPECANTIAVASEFRAYTLLKGTRKNEPAELQHHSKRAQITAVEII
jgi:hypothetical protein